jgi:hypothetical protein
MNNRLWLSWCWVSLWRVLCHPKGGQIKLECFAPAKIIRPIYLGLAYLLRDSDLTRKCSLDILFSRANTLAYFGAGSVTKWYYPTYDRIQFTSLETWINLCIYAPLWRQNHFESLSLWRWLLPHISGSGSLIRIELTFVLFKHVTLMWINYLETWPRSDNMSCY